MGITEDQARAFAEDGFLAPVRIADPALAQAYRRRWDELEARETLRERDVTRLHSLHLDQEFVWEIASSDVLLDTLEHLLGPNVLLFGSRVFCKYGPDEKFVSWHQDVYPETWGLEPPIAVTAWYAFDDCDEENGCMYMIPGSHRRGILEHRPSGRPGNLLRLDQEVEVAAEDAARAVPVTLRSGEVSLHDGATLHYSGPNRSTRRRSGIALRYVPTHVRQRPGRSSQPRSSAILVRGVDEDRHFGDHPWPFPRRDSGVAGRS